MMTTRSVLPIVLALVSALGVCSSASTGGAARVTEGAVERAVVGDAVGDAAGDAARAVEKAIASAVRARMGDTIRVRVTELRLDVSESGGLRAVPDPSARAGRLVRFTLQVGSRRAGDAVARIDISGPHVRTRRPLARDVELSAEDLEVGEGELPMVRFGPLPVMADVVGQRLRRAVAAGEVVTEAIVVVPDAVRSGDEVRALVRVGAVEAWGTGRAWGSGRVGEVIRVTKGTSRTASRARIVAPGIVEIVR